MSDLLRYAASSAPLISLCTSDPMNVGYVLRYVTGKQVNRIVKPPQPELWQAHIRKAVDAGGEGALLFVLWNSALDDVDWMLVRTHLSDYGSTLAIINGPSNLPGVLNVGELHVPYEVILESVQTVVADKQMAEAVTQCLAGLTLSEAVDILRMAQAKAHEVTPTSVKDVRAMMHLPRRGVQLISPEAEYYVPPENVASWLQDEGWSLLSTTLHPEVRPRGLLLTGPPGTGKTAAARHIASRLEVSLFRLDIGAVQSKYVGESEAYLSNALSYIAAAEPCVVLVDEVEKLFAGQDDSGVSRKLLAGLLWWLQEHRARVLTIMTTNNLAIIPPELYRPGRIDTVLHLGWIASAGECLSLLFGYLGYLCPEATSASIDKMVREVWQTKSSLEKDRFTHAELRELAKRYLRRMG